MRGPLTARLSTHVRLSAAKPSSQDEGARNDCKKGLLRWLLAAVSLPSAADMSGQKRRPLARINPQ